MSSVINRRCSNTCMCINIAVQTTMRSHLNILHIEILFYLKLSNNLLFFSNHCWVGHLVKVMKFQLARIIKNSRKQIVSIKFGTFIRNVQCKSCRKLRKMQRKNPLIWYIVKVRKKTAFAHKFLSTGWRTLMYITYL